MGSVFSIVSSNLHFEQRVLRLGAAASASAFLPFNPYYFSGLLTILPFCEPAEIEPFEDFSEIFEDLCHESSNTNLDTPLASVKRPRFQFYKAPLSDRPSVWRSETVERKKLHKTVADQAKQKALRFHRRYNLYGPPDWTDPALSVLPPTCLLSGNCLLNVFPSVFPFAAPHIVISVPAYNCMDPIIAWANGMQCQDEAFGDRLVVSDAPCITGPHPLIVNPVSRPPVPVNLTAIQQTLEPNSSVGTSLEDQSSAAPELPDIPSLAADPDGYASSCESSECGTVGDLGLVPPRPAKDGSVRDLVQTPNDPIFWIEEDEAELPELPEHW